MPWWAWAFEFALVFGAGILIGQYLEHGRKARRRRRGFATSVPYPPRPWPSHDDEVLPGEEH
jgi:hypothetical protein